MTPLSRLGIEAQGLGMTSQRARDRLVDRLRAGSPCAEAIRDPRVLDALRRVPRHLFIDEALASRAYEDTALPIGRGQTISQPWVVARMTEALIERSEGAACEAGAVGQRPNERGLPRRVLELGTGSGYQAAILATLVETVYTVERIDELLRLARRRFRKLGFDNIRCRYDDGRAGWPENAPYDAIIVTAATDALDPALLEQLAPGGTLVAPVGGSGGQQLLRLRREEGAWREERLGAVVFVPLLGGTL